MSSNYSGRTTPHSDVDHPHRITYSPFNEEEEPQPIPMPTLPLTPTPPRGTFVPPQITRTLWPTQNTHQTRITFTTTPPCSNPISKRIQNQETRLPPHIAHHILLFQRKNHQEQGKRKEKTSYPRTKKDQKRHRQSFRRHREGVGQKNGGILPTTKRTS